jgi:gentisate 1,2-dioxygenase
MLRYPWADTRAAIEQLAWETGPDETPQLRYVNPETAGSQRSYSPALGHRIS